MVKKVSLGDFAKELKEFSEGSIDVFKAAVAGGVIESLPDLVESSPVDTGLYAQSWDLLETEQSIILGNLAPHAPIIEFGARPFWPPLEPLLAWAKRVLKDASQPPEYSPEVQALARGTRAKIAREGMVPRHVLEKALPGIIENIRKEFQRLESGS